MSFEKETIRHLEEADIIDDCSSNIKYYGYFKPGKNDYANPVCKIIKKELVGNVWTKKYANGNMNYSNIWNNRTSLTYSHLL